MFTIEILNIAGNIAEILAGVAIIVSAVRAWPVLGDMQALIRKPEWNRAMVSRDLARVSESIARLTGEPAMPMRSMVDATSAFIALQLAKGGNLYFHQLGDDDDHPGVISLVSQRNEATEVCRLSHDGYLALFSAFQDLVHDTRSARSAQLLASEGDRNYILRYTTDLRGPFGFFAVMLRAGSEFVPETLGMTTRRVGNAWELVEPVLDSCRGLLILTGPNGSGISTTYTSFMNHVAAKSQRTISLAESREFTPPRVIELSRASTGATSMEELAALAMAQYPSLLGLGHIAPDTARVAWHAYGYECAVMISWNGREAVTGLIELNRQGGTRAVSVDEPIVIVGQVLSGIACQECRAMKPLSAELQARVEAIATLNRLSERGIATPTEFNMPEPCEHFKTRIALHEYVAVDQAMQDAAAAGEGAATLRTMAIERGMITTQCVALFYASQGFLTFDDAIRISRGVDHPVQLG